VASYARDGGSWADALGIFVLVFGMIAGLVYFFFSIEHKGPVGYVARAGVWILMLGFGASFGLHRAGAHQPRDRARDGVPRHDAERGEAVHYQSKLVSAICVLGIFGTVAYLQYRKNRLPPAAPPSPPPSRRRPPRSSRRWTKRQRDRTVAPERVGPARDRAEASPNGSATGGSARKRGAREDRAEPHRTEARPEEAPRKRGAREGPRPERGEDRGLLQARERSETRAQN